MKELLRQYEVIVKKKWQITSGKSYAEVVQARGCCLIFSTPG